MRGSGNRHRSGAGLEDRGASGLRTGPRPRLSAPAPTTKAPVDIVQPVVNHYSATVHWFRKATSRSTRCRLGPIDFPAVFAGEGRWVVSRSRDGRRWLFCCNRADYRLHPAAKNPQFQNEKIHSLSFSVQSALFRIDDVVSPQPAISRQKEKFLNTFPSLTNEHLCHRRLQKILWSPKNEIQFKIFKACR